MEETLEQVQARHRKEQKDLQSRITNKKKNATKKTRKGVNDECAELERQLKERQETELRRLAGGDGIPDGPEGPEDDSSKNDTNLPESVRDLACQLETTTLSPSNNGNTPSEPQGGKKRNRQKERLARRAAEQEAAAAAAESEAAGMVDHRGLERAYMAREFKAHALQEKDIEPDGHCLFSAMADQLGAHGISLVPGRDDTDKEKERGYKVVRRTAADYMASHADDFAGFLEEDLGSYVAKIRDTAEWGGQLELSALANAYRVEIRVVQDGRTEVIKPADADKETKTLWLAYYRHGYGLGEHYNSLRRAD